MSKTSFDKRMDCNRRIYQLYHKCYSHDHLFEIRNIENEIEYIVNSKSFPRRKHLSICEYSSGKQLIEIDKGRDHLHKIFTISFSNDQHLATVKTKDKQDNSQIQIRINSIYGVYHVQNLHFNSNQFQIQTGDEVIVNVSQNTNSSKHENIYDILIDSSDQTGDLFLLALVITIWYAKRSSHL